MIMTPTKSGAQGKCCGIWQLYGPSQYATFIATINAEDNRETVASVANKLRNYESMISGPMQAQCTLMPSEYVGAEPISIAGVTGGSQQLILLEAKVSLNGKEWQKHLIVTGPEAPCILDADFLQNGYYKDSKGLRWAFGIAVVEAEGIKKFNTLPGLPENPSAVGLLKVEEQQVPVATLTVHHRQYKTN
ncbi:hypothetical protein DUI87_03086 [Hirundo rustica rustica]|uniref:Uncharacterized protein n=1 Tax=Hirundo rustica rustica TaxID=333673 RepID=A0A3M0L1W7_HIRRU|nr:hypothetical protein DUI87_03086 [Hirundo rustica rustica]